MDADNEPVAQWQRPLVIGADGLPLRESRARRWLDLGHPDLDDAITAAVARLVRAQGREATAFAVADRIATAAVGYVRQGGAARHRIDAATITADPALAAFLAVMDGEDNSPWPRISAQAARCRWGTVRQWRQIGAGLLDG